MAWFDDFEHGYGHPGPIRVEGGLRARSKRGSIGSTWWSRRFIDILERVCDKGRLSRGRAYARQGQVLSIDLEAGEVRAAVQGSRRTPYAVVVRIEAFGESRWAELEAAVAAQAVHRARLLAGEMPPEIEELFAAAGVDLFPRDLDMDCSCPDWGFPCKHLSAVLYLLAEAFDDDPFLVLAWRGRTREQLLGSLAADRPAEPPAVADVPFAERLADFYAPGASVHRPERRPAAAAPGLLLRVFPPPADLGQALAPAYDRLGERPEEP
ncbi:SWIM zinc finger family protein [Actinomadura sp. ATCC 31491]|uniref:SWIM zinc finger family protein n=1 Tax=Actinomadura luzonensis TaxID=2805427 RepID=A0ABT0FZ78_9ACTN|nr:SWIM zinc finger family protein [Actinomadura luzonensis]MCK2217201.1 SWIM zinc finger family protein [Actinomadura luzonensis]